MPGNTSQLLSAEELARLCARNGVAPCSNAQADGVPCGALGGRCEQCEAAAQALREQRAASEASDPDLVILPTEIGA